MARSRRDVCFLGYDLQAGDLQQVAPEGRYHFPHRAPHQVSLFIFCPPLYVPPASFPGFVCLFVLGNRVD